MRIKTKLLLGLTLSGLGVLTAGAGGIWPLWQYAHLRITPTQNLLNDALRTAIVAAGGAFVIAVGIGLIIVGSLCRKLTQFRRDAEAIARGDGKLLKIAGKDHLDLVAAAMNEFHLKLQALEAKQIKEEELVTAKRYADNVIKSMFDVLIVTDPDLRIQTVNKAACELLDYTELELVGRPVESLFKEEPTLLSPPIRELLRNNQMRDFEATYRTRSGRLISVLLSASTMRDTAGRPLAVITVGKDITARKQIEHELLDAKASAEAASRAKSAFVANMSHEIRTPMTGILGYADLLTHDQNDEERKRCIQTIRRNGQHLLTVINDILDVSKIEAGKMTVERIACSPCQLVADVAALMRVRAIDKALTFDVRYIGAIPQSIQTDPTRLRQILMNLIGNAIKFTQQGGVKLLVSLVDAADNANPRIRFDIIDTGLGLTPQQQEKLFRPFAQADNSTTRKFGGTGLGLTISKRLANMLGGDLLCTSTPGAGSTFSLTVQTGSLRDVALLDSPQAIVEAADATVRQAEGVRLNGRVLLAEDGQDNRVLITFYLREAGLDVTEVENGLLARDRAFEALRGGNPFDLILMDMQMPELDGYSATEQLRKAGYHAPIVALTAHAMGGDREKCLSAGCDDFAVKPIDHDALMATLRKFILTRPEPAVVTPAQTPIQTAPPAKAPPITSPTASGNAHVSTPTSPPATTLNKLLAKPATAKLVARFLDGLPQRIAAIQNAQATGDVNQLKLLTHQLKGAAGGYGFVAISLSAAEVESAAASNPTSISPAVAKLAQQCASVRGAAA